MPGKRDFSPLPPRCAVRPKRRRAEAGRRLAAVALAAALCCGPVSAARAEKVVRAVLNTELQVLDPIARPI